MSCTFWLRRKKLAAEKAKMEAAAIAEETKVTEATEKPETPKKQGKKTAKKAGAENDNTAD